MWIEDEPECVEGIILGAVEDVHAAAYGNDHACLTELTEVVADGGFRKVDSDSEIAGADLPVVVFMSCALLDSDQFRPGSRPPRTPPLKVPWRLSKSLAAEFTGDLTAAAESEAVPLTERAVERRGTEPGICIQTFPWKAKDFGSRINFLTVELAKLTKERPNLVQDEWEEKVASWAGRLSEAWERSVTTEVMNHVFDRGSSQVRMLKFRMLAKITDSDNQELQEGYGATSKWGRRHDKSAETNYVAPEPADLERELTRLTDWQKRVRKYL